MGVSNGQDANETTFNDAFMDRLDDTSTIGKVDLLNDQAESGPDVINAQREINSLDSFTGRAAGSDFDETPTWTNNELGTGSDSLFQRSNLITERFNGTTGHGHTGVDGDGPQISTTDLLDIPYRGFIKQGVDITGITGGSEDISSQFSTKEASTGPTELGVPVTSPYNKAFIRDSTTNDPFEDGSGNQVYGRITNSGGLGGTWTLTYYVNISGTETPYSFGGSEDISWWYQELFSVLDGLAPVYDEEFFVPSDNATEDVVDATVSQAGKVNTGQQTFGGEKNFDGGFATEKLDIASAATINALSSSKSFERITGTTATTLNGITAPTGSTNKRLLIHNSSTGDLTITHQSGSALAVDRIISPSGDPVTVPQNSSIELIYEDAQQRWVVVSSGVGGGSILGFQEPLGVGNGATTSFGPLTNEAIDEESIIVFVDGIAENKSLWAYSTPNIVFSTAPAAGQEVYIFYLYNGTPPTPFVPSGVEQLEYRTISGPEDSAKALTLSATPASAAKVMVDVIGGTAQEYTVDFTVSGSTLDWNGYGLDGILVAGDKLRIHYWS